MRDATCHMATEIVYISRPFTTLFSPEILVNLPSNRSDRQLVDKSSTG